ncbi:MAG: gluconokinase [Candidatus Korobacteraceae bacterium]
MILVIMGVAGIGKTTVGQALAHDLHWRFVDADTYHSAANVAKMHAGIPLTDADREPWLASLHEAIVGWLARDENVVLACSALKASYRSDLVVSPEVKLVYLRGELELVASRLAARQGHYMNPDLLQSQFDALEEPGNAAVFDASLPVVQLVAAIRHALEV